MGIAPDDTVSPRVLRKVVYAGSHASSFRQASEDLKEEAEVEISEQRIMRATKRIGEERAEQRDAEVAQWAGLTLPEQRDSPREQVPQVACVEMDGGRIQIRDRKPLKEDAAEPSEEAGHACSEDDSREVSEANAKQPSEQGVRSTEEDSREFSEASGEKSGKEVDRSSCEADGERWQEDGEKRFEQGGQTACEENADDASSDDGKCPKNRPRNERRGRFWRETKVGCLLSLTSQVSQEDPCPQIPAVFVDPRRMRKMVREIKGFSADDEEESARSEASSEPRPGRPEVLVRSVTATRRDVHAFGKQLAAAAWQRGFAAAPRKAFVCDGLEANWTVWRTHFSHYTPILDFIHAIAYVYAAAMAGRRRREGWPIYCRWAQAVWGGQVGPVIEALRDRLQELGRPAKDESDETPRSKVASALRYLENQQGRMHYDQYRRQGLPITSSHIESTVKQINRRVKGTEKFWSDGAEALLQLSADYLSETDPLTPFWKDRPLRATGQRRYQTAS